MFTPVESSIGALLIQFATTSHLELYGSTIGFSSLIFNTIFRPSTYSLSVTAGLILSAIVTKAWLPDFIPAYTSYDSSAKTIGLYALAGVLVGAGSKLQSGCTSGHFLNGVSRLRLRSFIASAVFCSAAIALVSYADLAPACYDLTGLPIACYKYDTTFSLFKANSTKLLELLVAGFTSCYIALPAIAKHVRVPASLRDFGGINTGFWFGMGLLISGMASPAKPQGFLSLLNPQKFDPSLAMIVLFTIVPNIFIWHRDAPQTPADAAQRKPLLANKYSLPFSTGVSAKFLTGSVLFGIGWGLLGVCPGPGLLASVLNGFNGIVWLSLFVLGYYFA